MWSRHLATGWRSIRSSGSRSGFCLTISCPTLPECAGCIAPRRPIRPGQQEPAGDPAPAVPGNRNLRPDPHGSLIDFFLSENIRLDEPAPWVLSPAWVSRILKRTAADNHRLLAMMDSVPPRRCVLIRVGGSVWPMPTRWSRPPASSTCREQAEVAASIHRGGRNPRSRPAASCPERDRADALIPAAYRPMARQASIVTPLKRPAGRGTTASGVWWRGLTGTFAPQPLVREWVAAPQLLIYVCHCGDTGKGAERWRNRWPWPGLRPTARARVCGRRINRARAPSQRRYCSGRARANGRPRSAPARMRGRPGPRAPRAAGRAG